ncbi:hypothetical protein N7532_005164 [Penicillium argentinense]|uniref:Uncharacterized protein n=1 Tax=Penicillium argentinense TaxID=1131581 RepID=A0A9W9FDC8_9EURO|nr:uncharacterized protein N7532_005164 [Penicillium argentinense]KAJ5098163.1 hypothetical protein N7532_005164 [Penicillium argentinense]
MVALKKFFQQQEQDSSRPSTRLGLANDEAGESFYGTPTSPTRNHLEPDRLSVAPPSPGLPSPGSKSSQSMDVSHHFDQIDKQFEDLHQHMGGTRPVSSQSQLPPSVSTSFGFPRYSNSRHIDLMDALFISGPYQETIPTPASPPTSPYNEDVAERNMTRFLRIQHRKGFASSRILSALYQEDVADRNIAKYGGQTRSSSALSSRSSPPAPGRRRGLSPMGSDGKRRDSRNLNLKKGSWMSDGDLRNRSTPDRSSGASSQASNASTLIRLQRSAPTLSPEEKDAADNEPPAAIQRLGVPPAYKQGKRWSNTPLPDSPTLPFPISDGSEGSSSAESPPELQAPVTTVRASSLTPKSRSPPPSSGSTSRKNVRDLSINTQIATQGRPKISHRAIQPPTPSNYEMRRAPSIAEVMNSPLPEPTPSSGQPSPRFKVSEMMDLFKQAYMSTQAMSPHPTYETLQDAIVREINSHDAFKRVPVPTAGPPFTPSDQDRFSHSSGLNRSASAGQLSKIMRKGSFRKHKRNSESRQSISTSVPSKGFLRRPQAVAAPQTSDGNQLTYMDVLLRASNDKTSNSTSTNPPSSRDRMRSESTNNLSTAPRSTPDRPYTPGAVYCMQAHSDSSQGRNNGSRDAYEESDDEIIHLPSVGAPPRVQIEGVDENNVRYVIDSATVGDAHKFMSWPQRVRRSNSSQPACENSLSPLTRARMQLRGAHSVETY